ncbi:MAG: type II toxin-antitoxin system Phd/YefM family antitoxin [Anaerolineae bacterium]|nr:type II toxin-antitoxin system Phd/YefM family antitoxin [Anaerolineae bacterium]MCB0250713.1 type II toxin-antitoxin system Phd/YefM family antitoxin [Anaerolineae bacterium]
MQEKPTPMPDLVPLTDMRRRAGAVIDELHDDRATIVTSFGRPVAVLVSPYLWERLTEATS